MLEAPQLDQLAAPRGSAFPFRQTRRRIRTIILSTALIATFCAIAAPKTSAQDLGEIARQERVKKENNPAPPATHVYTNEDMHRQQILTPEDQSRFSATTQPATVAPPQSVIQLASELTPKDTALPLDSGLSVARVLRTRGPSPSRGHTVLSAASDTTSTRMPNPAHASAAQPNISSTSTTRAKTIPAPITRTLTQTSTRANISTAPETSGKSVFAPLSQSSPKTISSAAARPVAPLIAQIPVPQIAVQNAPPNIDAPIPTTIPLDQLPLGDVARYYRLKKHELARANAQIDPGPTNAPSAPEVATTIPNEIPLNQMPLGDIARYYRAKAREEARQHSQEVATNQTPSDSQTPKQAPASATAPASKYPLTLVTMPLASPKRTSTRARQPISSRIVPSATHPIAPTITSRRLVAPKRSVGGIRITSGDTLWQLARKYLGSATRWTELLSLNPTIQNPKRLQIGAELLLAPRSANYHSSPLQE